MTSVRLLIALVVLMALSASSAFTVMPSATTVRPSMLSSVPAAPQTTSTSLAVVQQDAAIVEMIAQTQPLGNLIFGLLLVAIAEYARAKEYDGESNGAVWTKK